MKRPFAHHVTILATLVALIVSPLPAPAQPAIPVAGEETDCFAIAEPNSELAGALDLGSGASCANAAQPNEGTDLFKWTVENDDTGTPWTFAMSAIPGNVGVVEVFDVEFDDAGNATRATKLISVRGEVG